MAEPAYGEHYPHDVPLGECFHCQGHLVHPVNGIDITNESPPYIDLTVRCGECGSRRGGSFPLSRVIEFRDQVQEARHQIASDLSQFARRNLIERTEDRVPTDVEPLSDMAEEIEAFIRALHSDAIEPDDF